MDSAAQLLIEEDVPSDALTTRMAHAAASPYSLTALAVLGVAYAPSLPGLAWVTQFALGLILLALVWGVFALGGRTNVSRPVARALVNSYCGAVVARIGRDRNKTLRPGYRWKLAPGWPRLERGIHIGTLIPVVLTALTVVVWALGLLLFGEYPGFELLLPLALAGAYFVIVGQHYHWPLHSFKLRAHSCCWCICTSA